MAQLILIEGLPGTGKTTYAEHLARRYRALGQPVELYLEGDLHPADLQWTARLAPDQDNAILADLRVAWEGSPRSESWEAILQRKAALTTDDGDHRLVAWTKLAFQDRELWPIAERYRAGEITQGRVPLDAYLAITRQRWQRFVDDVADKPTTIIFECAFFQSHIIELLGWHGQSGGEIRAFLRDLMEIAAPLDPSLIYLQSDDYAPLLRATGSVRPGWLDDVIAWVESSRYGREHELQGLDGALTFFDHRASIEQRALADLGIPITILPAQRAENLLGANAHSGAS